MAETIRVQNISQISQVVNGMEFYDIPGTGGLYKISICGTVKASSRRINSPASGGTRVIPERIMKPVVNACGYPVFDARINGKRIVRTIHRILAEIFIPNPDGLPCINHIDGDKTNFEITNLEWCTQKHNMRHAHETGLIPASKIGSGEKSPAAKLTEKCVRDIKARIKAGERIKDISARYPVSSSCISEIKAGRSWVGIGDE